MASLYSALKRRRLAFSGTSGSAGLGMASGSTLAWGAVIVTVMSWEYSLSPSSVIDGGGVSQLMLAGRGPGTTQPGRREGPLLHRRVVLEEGSGECPVRARSTAKADGLDKVRALQRVLYRSAKQQPHRRFHALFDKVARGDVLWRAWDEVRANRGAAGVDGITIQAVEASGVAAFLDDLAAALRAGSYRPAPLRRVDIPKPGQPGTTRPLGIPCVRDRVVMTAAKLVVEPIFEADFLPSSYRFRPKRSAHQACDAVRVEANRGREWVLDADVRDCLGVASHCPLAVGEGVE